MKLQVLRRKLLPRITNHLLHLIVGIYLVADGLNLILNDNYYSWPPDMAPFYNSDFVGTWALFTGLGMIYVAVQLNFPVKANIIWLLSACGFLGFAGFLELAHGAVFQNSHMTGYGMTLITVLLVNFYIIGVDTIRSKGRKLTDDQELKLEERDKKLEESR